MSSCTANKRFTPLWRIPKCSCSENKFWVLGHNWVHELITEMCPLIQGEWAFWCSKHSSTLLQCSLCFSIVIVLDLPNRIPEIRVMGFRKLAGKRGKILASLLEASREAHFLPCMTWGSSSVCPADLGLRLLLPPWCCCSFFGLLCVTVVNFSFFLF